MTSRLAQSSEPCGSPRLLLPALLLALWQLANAHAGAQPSDPIRLEWRAPQGCEGADAVQARVRELLGSSQAVGPPLFADATVTRREDGHLHLRLVVRADDLVGERSITGKSCDDLVGATAVALALLLRSTTPLTEADLTGSTTESEPSGGVDASPTRSATTTTPPSAPPAVLPAREPAVAGAERTRMTRERQWHGLLQLPLVAVRVGPLHEPSFGFSLAAGASFGRWSLLADGKAWLPQEISGVGDAHGYGADLRQFGAGVHGCRAFLWPRFQLAPCVAITAEFVSARGTGAHVEPQEARAVWASAGLGVQARWHVVRWLNMVAGMDVLVQTSRPQVAIDDVGIIEQLLPIAFLLAVGSEWIL